MSKPPDEEVEGMVYVLTAKVDEPAYDGSERVKHILVNDVIVGVTTQRSIARKWADGNPKAGFIGVMLDEINGNIKT